MQHSRLESPLHETLQHATEGEQADWYFGDDDEALARFEQAAKDGTLEAVGTGSEVEALRATISLPSDEMELAREQARALGMDTAAYLESVVRTAIQRKAAA